MSDTDRRPPFRKGGRGRPQQRQGRGGKPQDGRAEGRQDPRESPAQREDRVPKEPAIPFNAPDCPICQKPVTEIFAAIAEVNSHEPAHFDCIFNSIAAGEKIEPGEKLIYLGNGCFAVISYPDPATPLKFTIKKRIQYEERDKKIDWRRAVAKYKP